MADYLGFAQLAQQRQQQEVASQQRMWGSMLENIQGQQSAAENRRRWQAEQQLARQQETRLSEAHRAEMRQYSIEQASNIFAPIFEGADTPEKYTTAYQSLGSMLMKFGEQTGDYSLSQLLKERVPMQYAPGAGPKVAKLLRSAAGEKGMTEYQRKSLALEREKAGLTKREKQREAEEKQREAEEKKKTPDIKKTTDLRKEFIKESEDFKAIGQSFGRVQASVEDPSAAGDLALIFNYMKMLDPGSVVRESEFATAQNAGGVSERIRAQYNKVIEGERLSEKMRNDFWDRSKRLFKKQEEMHANRKKVYTRLAQRYNMDPDLVVIPLFPEQPAEAQPVQQQPVQQQPVQQQPVQQGVTTAPPAALEYLKNNPDKIDAFVQKYGYRPRGY